MAVQVFDNKVYLSIIFEEIKYLYDIWVVAASEQINFFPYQSKCIWLQLHLPVNFNSLNLVRDQILALTNLIEVSPAP